MASRVGGVSDIVSEGETGYTFESGDSAALLEGIRESFRQPRKDAAHG